MGAPGLGVPRRVLIVDDSRTIRALLRATLDADERLDVVGEAGDPYEARQLIKDLNPDVLTLDVEMPKMSGLEFLEHLMRLRPMPVVMVSSRTQERSEDAIRALSIGAVECVDVRRVQGDAEQRARLSNALYNASLAKVRGRADGARVSAPSGDRPAFRWNGKTVLIGSSTGGVDALERVLSQFPADCPPTVIAQHMPASFLASFSERLNGHVAPDVQLAQDLQKIERGQVRIAPGGTHHLVIDTRTQGKLRLETSDASDLYVPSVDKLFASALPHAATSVGVVLTGMGSDGAQPLADLRVAGAMTLAQRGDTCVVDGMPRAARAAGAVTEEAGIDDMAAAILRHTSKERPQ
ncbi:MAG: chemotaxis-specific protein-glutamate methyltransferase CheB [Pseudomonadota bacterium]